MKLVVKEKNSAEVLHFATYSEKEMAMILTSDEWNGREFETSIAVCGSDIVATIDLI